MTTDVLHRTGLIQILALIILGAMLANSAANPPRPSSADKADKSSAALKVGDSKARVLECLGKPQAEMGAGGNLILYYGGRTVELANGRVTWIDPQIIEAARGWKEKAAQPRAQESAPSPNPGAPPEEKTGPAIAPAAAPVLVISQGGKSVDLKVVLVPGKITIVDFYADWCGPCRALAPQLEALVNNDPDLCLRKIDIVRWDTEVTKQYQINSVPNVRVFDRNGQMKGRPSHSIEDIRQAIRQAK